MGINNTQVGCDIQMRLIDIKGPKVSQENIPHTITPPKLTFSIPKGDRQRKLNQPTTTTTTTSTMTEHPGLNEDQDFVLANIFV